MSINERIKIIRNKFSMNQEAFAENIGISRSRLANIELGSQTKDSVLISISKVFGINLNWLKTGEGNMLDKEKALSGLNGYDEAIMKMVLDMNEDDKKELYKYIQKEKRFLEMRLELEELKSKVVG